MAERCFGAGQDVTFFGTIDAMERPNPTKTPRHSAVGCCTWSPLTRRSTTATGTAAIARPRSRVGTEARTGSRSAGTHGPGRSNIALSQDLSLSAKTVEAHVRSIFTKLDLARDPGDHRSVLAVLAFLRS
jgi:hypothetical protein